MSDKANEISLSTIDGRLIKTASEVRKLKKAKSSKRSFILPPSKDDEAEIDRMFNGPPTNRQTPHEFGTKR